MHHAVFYNENIEIANKAADSRFEAGLSTVL